MALVERLMGLEDPKIPVHDFFAAQQQVAAGQITISNVKSFLQMDTAAAAEYDALIALYPTGTTATAVWNKVMYLQNCHAVFILAEEKYPGYDTPALVRAKIGL